MTRREQIIVSAYTGYMIWPYVGEIQDYIEEKIGRTVFTHELADPKIAKEIQDASKQDLIDICKEAWDNE